VPITANMVVLGLVALFALVLLGMAIRIVPEYQRLVVFRLGRLIGERGPGLVLLIPFVDRGVRVDLRERFFDVQPQTTITEDNAHLSIDFLVYSKVVDAVPSVVNVEDHEGASRGIAITTLRAVVGSMLLDDVLAKREEINQRLREKLDEVTNRWGIKVTAVEIREIKPPAEIEEAMTRQMSAERDRRAMVTEANGRREATIRVAEGERQAAILRAEGAAQALLNIFEAARQVDSNTMALQYLEMLRTVGAAESTKFVVPAELLGLLRPFLQHNAAAAETKEEG
jgi:regulator of protease activity HflC (stomatin/prohibitin superfamily)